MSILGGTIKEGQAAGIALENNALDHLEETIENLADHLGPEGEALILELRNALNLLLASGVQAGEALMARGEIAAKGLIAEAAKYEVVSTVSVRLRAEGKK